VKAALCADSVFDNGSYTTKPEKGLKAFGRVYCGWAYSQDWFREKLYQAIGFKDLDGLLLWWENDHLAWDANDLLAMLWTWQHADISQNEKFKGDFLLALRSIKARAVVVPSTTDLYFPVTDNEIEVQAISNAELRPMASKWGHMAGSPRALQAEAQMLQLAFAAALAPKHN